MVEIMQTGFGKCNILISNKNLFEYISAGFTNEVRMGSDNGFEPTKQQAINSLAPGRSECYCKKAFFNVVLLIGIFGFSYDNAISCHGT